LIQRAKTKKNYAKILKEEGMASNRLSDRSDPKNSSKDREKDMAAVKSSAKEQSTGPKALEKGKGRERTGLVKDPYAAFKASGAGSDYSDDEDEDEEEKGTAVEIQQVGRKRALSLSRSPSPPPQPKHDRRPANTLAPGANRIKGKGKEEPRDRATLVKRVGEGSAPSKRPVGSGSRREEQRPGQGHKQVERLPSMRDMKKEAHVKRALPAARGASYGGGRGGKGQPNMGARMGVLLEAIKRGSK
jgi:hypothetical protein